MSVTSRILRVRILAHCTLEIHLHWFSLMDIVHGNLTQGIAMEF